MVLNITLTGREPEVTSITSGPIVCGRNEFQEGNNWRSVVRSPASQPSPPASDTYTS